MRIGCRLRPATWCSQFNKALDLSRIEGLVFVSLHLTAEIGGACAAR